MSETMKKDIWKKEAARACEQIRQLREAGYSQIELAEKLEVSEMTIRRWEYRRSLPNQKNIKKIKCLYPNLTGDRSEYSQDQSPADDQRGIEFVFWG